MHANTRHELLHVTTDISLMGVTSLCHVLEQVPIRTWKRRLSHASGSATWCLDNSGTVRGLPFLTFNGVGLSEKINPRKDHL